MPAVDISDPPEWANQLIVDIGELKKQVLTNCAKLDAMKENIDLIPQVLEIVEANGNNHEELSKRVNKLEK